MGPGGKGVAMSESHGAQLIPGVLRMLQHDALQESESKSDFSSE